MNSLAIALKYWLSNISNFSRLVIKKPLRVYQLEPAHAILDSILRGKGETFAVMMARQAGKNELSGQLEAYLLNLFRLRGGQIVKASPTFKPQTQNSIDRLGDRLDNVWNRGQYRRRAGYMVELGKARVLFFSAGDQAQVVGATADILLEGDEAQDIGVFKWGKSFRPMGAATNVTSVLWGTAWTSNTLLAQTIDQLRRKSRKDGQKRVFLADADKVALEVPNYGRYVKSEIERLGESHPLIQTQYFLKEIDGEGKYLNRQLVALMHGNHERQRLPTRGRRYAMLVDVGGIDEIPGTAIDRAMMENSKRDATALTYVEIELRSNALPLYRVVNRELWLGIEHAALHQEIMARYERWRPMYVVVDASGVGAGLASFLRRSIDHSSTLTPLETEKVIPVLFSPKMKSQIGWGFLGIVGTGRYQDYVPDNEAETRQFWYEVGECEKEIGTGPQKSIKWGVWETPKYDGLIAYGHDDLLISAALTAILEKYLPIYDSTGKSAIVDMGDVLEGIDEAGW